MRIYAVKVLDISEEKLDKLCLYIDLEKKHKIKKFINKMDKFRTLLGEILLRTIIAVELEIENKHIKFVKNEYGKPYLEDHPNFCFNLSHSGDFVLCAIDDKPIGIDIEEVKCIKYEEIAKDFFTTSEFDYIIKKDSNSPINKFYEIWTLKESYIKCCGQGLTIPLKSFSVNIDSSENIKVITDNAHNNYTFKKFDMFPDYKIALCSLNKEISNKIIRIDQNDLINKYFSINID